MILKKIDDKIINKQMILKEKNNDISNIIKY